MHCDCACTLHSHTHSHVYAHGSTHIPHSACVAPLTRQHTTHYTLHTQGTGTFGRVFLVKSKINGKFYALKKLSKSLVIKLKQVEHLRSEKRVLSQIHHPFVVN